MGRKPLNKTEREKQKGWYFTLELYPDSTSYDCGNIIETAKVKCQEFAYILHGNDVWTAQDVEKWDRENPGKPFPYQLGTDKKAHIHLVVKFDNSKELGFVARTLGIDSRFVQKVESRSGMMRYLLHKDNPEKYQYPVTDLITNIPNFEGKYLKETDSTMKACSLLEFIITCPRKLTISEVAVWATQNLVWDEFRRGQHIFTAIIFEHNNLIGEE